MMTVGWLRVHTHPKIGVYKRGNQECFTYATPRPQLLCEETWKGPWITHGMIAALSETNISHIFIKKKQTKKKQIALTPVDYSMYLWGN